MNDLKLANLWIYLGTDMADEANLQDRLAIVRRAAKAGYTGIVMIDRQFLRFDTQKPEYFANLKKFRQTCRDLKLDVIAMCSPFGYSGSLMLHDPNLAEGVPVKNAPFLVKNGQLVPADPTGNIFNGSFDEHYNDIPAGWEVTRPGYVCFMDTKTAAPGSKASLRMENIGGAKLPHGRCSAVQKLKVDPFRTYHVRAWIKTEAFESAGRARINVSPTWYDVHWGDEIEKYGDFGWGSLTHRDLAVQKDQDWTPVDIAFNSYDNSEVYLRLDVTQGKSGTIWWDNITTEPNGLTNIVRRAGTPLKATSADGKTEYVEGKDFSEVRDPLLGKVPNESFTPYHEMPVVKIPALSRIKEGDTVLMSYYHMICLTGGAEMVCMQAEGIYERLEWQMQQIAQHVQPDAYFTNHDEIRCQGWDESCRKTGLTPGEMLGKNIQRVVEIIHKHDPGKKIWTWSDMFDPYHNAQSFMSFFQVRGKAPWFRSWEYLPAEVGIINWHGFDMNRCQALGHFTNRGHVQILAGFYDGDWSSMEGWLHDAAITGGVVGAMYTTWSGDYSSIERYAEQLAKYR